MQISPLFCLIIIIYHDHKFITADVLSPVRIKIKLWIYDFSIRVNDRDRIWGDSSRCVTMNPSHSSIRHNYIRLKSVTCGWYSGRMVRFIATVIDMVILVLNSLILWLKFYGWWNLIPSTEWMRQNTRTESIFFWGENQQERHTTQKSGDQNLFNSWLA